LPILLLYYETRVRKENYHADLLASELGSGAGAAAMASGAEGRRSISTRPYVHP
jgi:hypothetical protein